MINAIFDFAQRRPHAYFGICCAIGIVIRVIWAKGDLWLAADPRFPLFM